tara:strand:+ start:3357 stop:3707 length:351 start_codon:yes stop_codon:yes gene_type:complete
MTEQVVEKTEITQESKMESWTSSEKENSKKVYGCEIMIENGTWEQVTTKECPNDAHIIKYEVDGETRYDLTRSQKVVNIFNMYWDKFRDGLKSIEYGKGAYNPKLWGAKAPKEKKK